MPVRMWAYPYLTWAVIVVIPAMLVYMATQSGQRLNIGATAVIAAVVLLLAVVSTRRKHLVKTSD